MAAFGAGDQVSGQGATHNLPNFPGELFKLSPLETPLLALIGGIHGGRSVTSTQFTWQDTLHRAPADQVIAEGADATFANQKRTERKNVVQIFQYGVELTYSKQAATGLIGTSLAGAPSGVAGVTSAAWLGTQPVMDEMSWQLQIKLEQAALDVEWAFLNNTFANPNTSAARQTQGVIGAITTIAKSATEDGDWSITAPTAVSGRLMANETMLALYGNGAPLGDNMVLMLGGNSKLQVSGSFQQNGNIQPRSYNRFGVNITEIETDFGNLAVVLNRHITPTTTTLFLNLDVIEPCFMPIPGRGHFFLEPLAKSGSYDRQQLYGEIGLKYGPEGWHAKVTNFDGVSATT